MKRYVNFMSNPDERTAIDQFGKGDKCFGVAALMSTLPGLPMFGHGQIEGFTEKYGMEYQRPRYDEWPDHWLVERHDREIAPLLKRRWLFAESTNFLLYDFFQDSGVGRRKRLCLLQSHRQRARAGCLQQPLRPDPRHRPHAPRPTPTKARASFASARSGKVSASGSRLHRRLARLAHRPRIPAPRPRYGRPRPDRSSLHAYQCHVFLDWRELHATADKPWDRLCDQLGGRGCPVSTTPDQPRAAAGARRSARRPGSSAGPHACRCRPKLPRRQRQPTSVHGKKQSRVPGLPGAAPRQLITAAHAAWERFTGKRRPGRLTRSESLAPVYRKCLRGAMRLLSSKR